MFSELRPLLSSPLDAAKMGEFSEARAYAAIADKRVEVSEVAGGVLFRGGGDASTTLFNRAIGVGLRSPVDRNSIDALAGCLAPLGRPWGLEIAPAAAAMAVDLPVWLRGVRLRRSLPTAVLAMDCGALPSLPTRWRVELAGPERSAEIAALVKQVFGISDAVASQLQGAAAGMRVRPWVAFDGDRAVASCFTCIGGPVAWFGWSATLQSHRNRGLQTALLLNSIQDAAAQGCRYVTAETALGTALTPDASYRNMLRFGFVEMYRRQGYICMPRQAGGRVAERPAP